MDFKPQMYIFIDFSGFREDWEELERWFSSLECLLLLPEGQKLFLAADQGAYNHLYLIPASMDLTLFFLASSGNIFIYMHIYLPHIQIIF